MKSIISSIVHCVLLFLMCEYSSWGQGYNQERTDFSRYLKRMIENAPFEGVRIVESYDNCYLISVLSLDSSKYPSESAMSRVASVKAMSQASRYFNGANITSEIIIKSVEDSNGYSDTQIIEHIREHSIGYIKALELITSFPRDNGWYVFVFGKQLELRE